jgi:hypothetical protein
MKNLNDLIALLKVEIARPEKEAAFHKVIAEIAQFYMENLRLKEEEIAIFLANDEKTILSFAHPAYLINAGMIPINSTEATAAAIFRRGGGVLDNNFQQQRHLSVFEIIPTPDKAVKPLWKMIGALIPAEGEKIGVIELSRRAPDYEDAGEDFMREELEFLVSSILKLGFFIKKVMPSNFRGKIT